MILSIATISINFDSYLFIPLYGYWIGIKTCLGLGSELALSLGPYSEDLYFIIFDAMIFDINAKNIK
jgi:hypothetical protein